MKAITSLGNLAWLGLAYFCIQRANYEKEIDIIVIIIMG